METNKIPTYREFLLKRFAEGKSLDTDIVAIEFAKMHVKRQQEEIINKVTANGNIRTDLIDFIPKCYPLENIK